MPIEGVELEVRELLMLETNLDNMNPEFYEHVMNRLFAAGALDVNLLPMQMKKNRPATLLRVLCAPEEMAALRDILLHETTTLGVRVQSVTRYALPRHSLQVQTEWGRFGSRSPNWAAGKAAPFPNTRIAAASPRAPTCRSGRFTKQRRKRPRSRDSKERERLSTFRALARVSRSGLIAPISPATWRPG